MPTAWFHTGDLAVWDETGSIHIVDRKKDVIISGGENISSPRSRTPVPAPGRPRVRGARVPHDKWGETPRALVVRAPAKASRSRS